MLLVGFRGLSHFEGSLLTRINVLYDILLLLLGWTT